MARYHEGLPGIPIFFPYSRDGRPYWTGFAKEVQGYARQHGGLKTGTYGSCPVIWGNPAAECFRVQDTGLPIGLHRNESPHGQEDSPGTDIFLGVSTWYVTLGMNYVLLGGNFSGDGHKDLIRQSLLEVQRMCAQIVVDPECGAGKDMEMIPFRHPMYSRNYQPNTRNFAPNLVACDCDVVPMWDESFTVD